MSINLNGADNERASQAIGRQTGGTFNFKQPLHNKRRPKLQVGKSTREVIQLGTVPRLTSDEHLEFALSNKDGRTRFRFTLVSEGGQRHRFHLDPPELLATVSAIHKCRSIMGAGA